MPGQLLLCRPDLAAQAVGGAARLAGGTVRRVCRCPGFLQGALGGAFFRQGRRSGMVQRAAHRAGHAVRQRLGQNARLGVQKCALQPQGFSVPRRRGVPLFLILPPGLIQSRAGTRRFLLLAAQGAQLLPHPQQIRLRPPNALQLRPDGGEGRPLPAQIFQMPPGRFRMLPVFLQDRPGRGEGVLRLLFLPAQVLQRLIIRQAAGDAVDLQRQGRARLLPAAGRGILFFRLRQLFLQRGGVFRGAIQRRAGARFVFGPAQPAVQGRDLLFQGMLLRVQRISGSGVLRQQFLRQGHKLRRAGHRGGLPGRLQPRGKGAALRAAQAVCRLADGGAECLIPFGPPAGLGLEPLLQDLVAPGAEQLPENLAAFLGFGVEELEERPLGDHGHLGKLTPVQARQLRHSPGHLPAFRHRGAAVKKSQLRVGALRRHAFAAALGPLILRVAADAVCFPAAEELHLHISGRFRVGVFAAEHVCLPLRAAGLTVKGEGDGVEDRRLSRAGVAGDEIQPPVPQLCQIDLRLSRVGAEGGENQLCRSHGSSSQIFSISARAKSRCCGARGRPFCAS